MNYNFSNWADIVFDKWIQLRSVFRFYTPWYRQESKGFVVLLGIMLREHCSEMAEGQFRYVLKVISQNTRCMFGICSKLKMKTTEQLYHVFSMSFGYYQHIWSSVSFITIEIVVACPHTNECYLRHIQDKSFFSDIPIAEFVIIFQTMAKRFYYAPMTIYVSPHLFSVIKSPLPIIKHILTLPNNSLTTKLHAQ